MDCKICFILIGVITLTTGRPAKDESSILVADENELQQLLKTLYSNGKFDISFSHHEDGPQSHHEDQAHISPHDDRSHESHHHHEEARHSHGKTRSSHDEVRSSHDEVRHRHDSHHGSHKHTSIHKNPSLTNIQNLNLIYKKNPSNPSDNNYDEDVENVLALKTKNSENSVVRILELLKDLDKNGVNIDKLGRSSTDNRDDDCGGGRCSRSDDNNNNGNNNDHSEKNSNNVGPILNLLEDLTKNGGSVSQLSRASDSNRDDDCGGGRCSRSDDNVKNSEKNNIKVVPIENLLKGLDLNGATVIKSVRTSSDNRDDDDDDDCRGGCGGRSNDRNIDRSGRGRDDNDNNNDDRDRVDDDDGDSDYIRNVMRADRDKRISEADSYIEQQIKSNAHRYKISDELDAIVVDMSGLQNSLGNADDRNDKEPISNVRLIENVGYPNVIDPRNDDSEEQVRDHNGLDSDSQPIKAVVVDLTKSEVDLASPLEELLKNIQLKSGNARASNKQNSRIDDESKILSHNEDNNNVYVPKWLLDEVIAKTNLRADPEPALKHLLPMTAKQKQRIVKAIAIKNSNASKRIFRRSVEDDIGVPFHLEVQGLGQVNP